MPVLVGYDEITQHFDGVILCTGHHAKKCVPDFPGAERFKVSISPLTRETHMLTPGRVQTSAKIQCGKPVYRSSFRLGRNDEIRKEYLSTGY